jgi:hypothetical protein
MFIIEGIVLDVETKSLTLESGRRKLRRLKEAPRELSQALDL